MTALRTALLAACLAVSIHAQSGVPIPQFVLSGNVPDGSTRTVTISNAFPFIPDSQNTGGLYVDSEAMQVVATNTTGSTGTGFPTAFPNTILSVGRGVLGTTAVKHNAGAVAYAGYYWQFVTADKSGSCPAYSAQYVNVADQLLFTCVSGSWSGVTTVVGGGGGPGSVTTFLASSSNWPLWLIPSVSSPTTTPSLSVTTATEPASWFLGSPSGSSGQLSPRPFVLSDLPTGYPYANLNGAPTINAASNGQFALYTGSNVISGHTLSLADFVTLFASGSCAGVLKFDGTCPGVVTTIGSPGLDTNLPTEKAVRAAITAAGGGNVNAGASLASGNVVTGAGSTSIQDSTKAAPTGAFVGTTDTQPLTNKSIAASEVNSGTLAAAQMAAFTGDVTKPSGSLATTVTALNGTSLAGLATGIVKNTTTTGVPTIAAGGFDFMSPDPINPKDAHAPDGTTVLGCKGDGTTDDTTCLTNLVTYLNAHPLSHVSFPAGKYLVNGTLRLNGAIRLDGAGANASFLVETNATADLLVLVPTTSTPLTGGRGFGPIIQNIGFSGQGSATTGNLLFMQGVGRATLDHVAFYGHGGRALLLANERTYMHDIHWSNVRQGISTSPNWSVNESYLNNYSVSDAGFAFDDVTGTTNSCNYNVNAVSCALPGSGTIVQDQHPFFAFDSNVVDFKISTGSIKPTWIAAIGVRGAQNFEIEHTYFEGYNNGNVNPSIIYGGNHEKTTLTNTISNSVTTFDLVSGAWFPGVVSVAGDIASLSENGQYVRMLIRPPDFIAGSGTASSLGGGITKGMFEYVTYQGIVHDAVGSGWHVHLNARAQNSSTAEAWPAGAVFSETSGDAVNAGLNGIGFTNAAPLKLADNHFNSVSTATGYTISTDANNEKVQGEMVLGFEPDLYYLWGAAQALSSVQRGYTFQGNNQLISSGSAVASIIDTYGYAIIDDAANPNVYSSGFPTNDNHVGLGALGGQYALRETFAAGGGGELDVRDPAFFAIVQGGNTPSVSGYSLPYNGNAVFGNITVTGCSGCGGGGGGAFQANGTPLTSTSTINLENSAAFNGLTATFANPSAGNVQLGFTGTLGNAGLTNSSLTVSAGAGLAGGGSVALGASTSLSRSVAVNPQTGTSYTVLSSDQGKLVTFSNSSAVAITLPQATGSFGADWFADFQNKGLGPVTITPTTSTISGGSSWLLNFGNGGRLVSDGTNYQLIDINGGGLSFQAFSCTGGTPCTITHNLNTTVYVYDLIDSSNNSISIKPCTESTSSITCTFTANQSGTAKFIAAGGALSSSGSGITALTGDGTASGSGSVALTLATVNSGPGSCGDSTHVCQVTTNGKGLVTAQSAVAISGGGGSGWTIGLLSGLPGTCATGSAYFATDQPAGQQLYLCSATNTFTQFVSLGSSGGLAFTAGALDINTAVVPTLAAANAFTGLNTFGTVQVSVVAFASLPTCNSGAEGSQRSVNDSTTNTWGATITGGGSDHVLGYCDGSNWTVMAK